MMNHLDLFSGIGGFALAAQWVWGKEHNIVSFVEIDKYCGKVLKQHWPMVSLWDDVTTFDGNALCNIDLITGGFPCQDISIAGKGVELKEKGLVFGQNLSVLLASVDLSLHSLRMSQLSLIEDSIESYATLPKSGMMRNGNVYLQAKWEHGISGRESGLLPTPITGEPYGGKGEPPTRYRARYAKWKTKGVHLHKPLSTVLREENRGDGGRMNMDWTEWLMGWPITWTDLPPLATAKYQQWLRSHGNF